jgi:hypothetical protein
LLGRRPIFSGPTFLLGAALALAACACSTSTGAATAKPELPRFGPASWQGPMADQMNQQAEGPITPALKSLQGQAPLAYVARVPARDAADDPAYELAVFDDGTFVYEGHRCVKVGGVVLTRVGPDALTSLQDVLAKLCTGLDDAHNDDELCADAPTLHVACSNGERMQSGSDHCRKRNQAQGQRIDELVTALGERLDLASWVGEPTRRQACTRGARDLSPHELARTIRPDLTDVVHASR